MVIDRCMTLQVVLLILLGVKHLLYYDMKISNPLFVTWQWHILLDKHENTNARTDAHTLFILIGVWL